MKFSIFSILLLSAAPLMPVAADSSKATPTAGVRLDTTGETYVLFLDMFEVERLDNAELVVGTAAKHRANPVLPLGDLHEWDSLAARPWGGTLIYDREEKLFKAWYVGMDHSRNRSHVRAGYAISKDGVVWQKPNLGLYEYGGNKNNNIVYPCNDVRIIKDPVETDAAKRYQMLSQEAGSVSKGGQTYFPFYSADGIHWVPKRNVPVVSDKLELHHLLLDPYERDPSRRIKLYGKHGKQPANKPGPLGVRVIAMDYGPDIEHTTPSPANPILHPNDGLEQELHFGAVFPYRGYYLLLYNYGKYVDYYGQGRWGKMVGDIRLAVSRDGEHFQRVKPYQPVVRRGQRGEWDSAFLLVANAVDFEGGIHIYYSGGGEQWASWPSDNTAVGPREKSLAPLSYPSQMGLAVLRADGFTHLQARDGYGPGLVTTVPIQVKNSDRAGLCVNVSNAMAYRDWVEVEILDPATGKPIPGYSREDCDDLAGDGASLRVSWGSANATLAAVSVPAIKLRFYLHGEARLHSFTFNPYRP